MAMPSLQALDYARGKVSDAFLGFGVMSDYLRLIVERQKQKEERLGLALARSMLFTVRGSVVFQQETISFFLRKIFQLLQAGLKIAM